MTRHRASIVHRLLIACLPFLLLLRTGPAAAQDHETLVSALDSAAAVQTADSTVAGVAAAVVHRGDTLLLGGYGLADLEFEVPTPPDAVYEIGSITKQFTAAAILLLAGADSLGLDDDVAEHLGDLNTRGHEVTVRELLHHTSGLRSYTTMSQFFSFIRDGLPRDTVVSLVGREPLEFAPGTAMIHNNSGGVERTPAALADSLAKVVLGPGDQPDGDTVEGDFSELTGCYTGPARGELMEVEIAAEDGVLVVREVGREDEDGTVLRYVSGRTWGDGDDRYRFVRAGDRIVELRLDVIGGHYPLRKSGPR